MSTTAGITLALAIIGAVFGLIGTVLSLVNTWRLFDRDRVKLRVVPKFAIGVGALAGERFVSISVTNLSAFPVTISEVGFRMNGTTDRIAILAPRISDGGTLPRRMDSRTTCSFQMELHGFNPAQFVMIRCAYVETDCGVSVDADSPALQSLVKQARGESG